MLIRQQGMTLIEILVSLAVGILLLTAASSVGLASLASSKDSIINGNAQQQLQMVMNSLTRELHRAGYSFKAETSKTATGFRNIKFFGSPANCIVFSYDRLPESTASLTPPGNGIKINDEVRGIRINNNRIELLTSTTAITSPASCAAAGTWEVLSNNGLKITGLEFTPTTVMLIDGNNVVDQINISITANSNTTPPHALNLSEVIQLRNRPFSNN